MKMKQRMMITLLAAVTILAGCEAETAIDEPDLVVESVSEEPLSKTGESIYAETTQISGTAVEIPAHIKEINDDKILISSDSDDFPGVFYVEVTEDIFDISRLQGGVSVRVLMQDQGETDDSGISEYLAKKLIVLDEQRNNSNGYPDVLLLDAPAFALTDPLSSTYHPFEVYSGNYSWQCMIDGEMSGVIACGAHPLDDVEHMKLTLPQYQNMDMVNYFFSTTISPDRLIIRKWDEAEIGNTDAKEISVITVYDPEPTLELEKNRVYEFTAIWKEERADERGFYGEASYTVVTGS